MLLFLLEKHTRFQCIDKTKKEIEDVVGIDTSDAIKCSGKTGEGIDEILESIIKSVQTGKNSKYS